MISRGIRFPRLGTNRDRRGTVLETLQRTLLFTRFYLNLIPLNKYHIHNKYHERRDHNEIESPTFTTGSDWIDLDTPHLIMMKGNTEILDIPKPVNCEKLGDRNRLNLIAILDTR